MWNWIKKGFNFIRSLFSKKKKEDDYKDSNSNKYIDTLPKDPTFGHIKATTRRKEKAERKRNKQAQYERVRELLFKVTGSLDKELTEKLNKLYKQIEEEKGKKALNIYWNMYQSIKSSGYNFYSQLLSSQEFEDLDYKELSESFYNQVVAAYKATEG